MQVAPSPSSGPRIQELGDTLVVTFPARRSWGALLFLGFWLTFWTFGGIAAMHGLASADWGGRVFLGFWLCGWALGEVFAASAIAWQLAGREVLTLTPNQLELRKQVSRFCALRQRLHVLAIDDVGAERVPTEDDEKERTDYCLRIVSRDATLLVGEGMGEYEAETLVLLIRERVHPRRAWREDPPEYGFVPAADAVPAVPDSRSPPLDHEFHWGWVLARIAPALIGAVVIAFVVFAVLRPLGHAPPLPRFSSPPAAPTAPPRDLARVAGAPPLRRDFHDPRAYAVAMTRYSLRNGRMTLESTPRCAGGVTWTRWICRARATSHIGPFTGRSLVYACVVADTRPGSPMLGILCGPEHPPPITP